VRHVAVNAVFLRPRMGGLETYLRSLLPALAQADPGLRITVFVSGETGDWLAGEPWAGQVDLATHRLLGLPGLRAAAETTVLGRIATRTGAELLYSPAMTGPIRLGIPHVVAVHDLIWLLTPDPGDRATNLLWRAVVPPVARRADRVICGSLAARDEVVEHLRVRPERVDVIAHGHGAARAEPTPAAELRERLALGDARVLLTVSAKRRHKNLIRLLRAVGRVQDAVLVMPGNPTPHERELRAEADALGIAERVRLLPYVSAEDLEGLYALCDAFVFPSLHEGFGLPVLEAMSRGVPVACARASSLPEVAGDAARLFDPLDVGDIEAAIRELLGDRARAEVLARAGCERAATFTWEAAAERTLDCWRRAIAERGAA
jgi:glycosyltransferase involved in cell wall biosynthesis